LSGKFILNLPLWSRYSITSSATTRAEGEQGEKPDGGADRFHRFPPSGFICALSSARASTPEKLTSKLHVLAKRLDRNTAMRRTRQQRNKGEGD